MVSGNDAAVALAEHLAGSEEAFVERMNQRAAELGMEDTYFVNCTGLPAAGHLTCAHDIAVMSPRADPATQNPGLHHHLDGLHPGRSVPTGQHQQAGAFLGGATGLKTGSTGAAVYCLSATAERDGMELIAVVLKVPTSAQRFESAKSPSELRLRQLYPDGYPAGRGHPASGGVWVPWIRCSPFWDRAAGFWWTGMNSMRGDHGASTDGQCGGPGGTGTETGRDGWFRGGDRSGR